MTYQNFKISREIFIKGIQALKVCFGDPQRVDFVESLYQTLGPKFDTELFYVAVRKLREEFKPTSTNPWPVAVHFLEAASETEVDKAERVLMRFRDKIRFMNYRDSYDFGDPALHATVRSFGGLLSIQKKNFWDINHARFLSAYRKFNSKRKNLGEQGRHIVGELEPFRIKRLQSEGKVYLPKWMGYGKRPDIVPQIENKKETVNILPEVEKLTKALKNG